MLCKQVKYYCPKLCLFWRSLLLFLLSCKEAFKKDQSRKSLANLMETALLCKDLSPLFQSFIFFLTDHKDVQCVPNESSIIVKPFQRCGTHCLALITIHSSLFLPTFLLKNVDLTVQFASFFLGLNFCFQILTFQKSQQQKAQVVMRHKSQEFLQDFMTVSCSIHKWKTLLQFWYKCVSPFLQAVFILSQCG